MANTKEGELLDKLDFDRVEQLKGTRVLDLEPSSAREQLLGKETVRRLGHRHSTLIDGSAASNPTDTATFLYFYPTLAFRLCEQCPQVRSPELIEPFLERGMAVVLMQSSFVRTPKAFQQMAYRHSEAFYGPDTLSNLLKVEQAWSVVIDEKRHYCEDCATRYRHGILKDAAKAGPVLFEGAYQVAGYSRYLYGPMQIEVLSQAATAVRKKDVQGILRAYRLAELAYHLACSQSLDVIAQVSNESLSRSSLFARAIRIDIPRGVAIDDYLDFLQSFRGYIQPDRVPASDDAVLRAASKLNDEVHAIESSPKFALGREFAFRIVPQVVQVVSRIVSHGVLDKEVPEVFRRFRHSKAPPGPRLTKFLARYFKTSPGAIHLWQVREGLHRISRRVT